MEPLPGTQWLSSYILQKKGVNKLLTRGGAVKMVVMFEYFDAGKDWWWGIVNLEIRA
ncbi:hypothetical protein OAG06_00795 [Verrucomicrobia bacterium]|jgi:hypothetical protein|nr:hypothetical protein [Verrucomicrobiota bacterium]